MDSHTENIAENVDRERPATKREQRAASIEALLGEALALFITQGYHATTVEEIAQAAGLTKGAVYFYFKSKANVLKALLDRMGDDDAVAVASSKPQPLCAWYRFRALASAIELFAAGERRLTGLYGSLNVTEVSNLEGVDLGTVTLGVNTPEDYSEALRRAGLAG